MNLHLMKLINPTSSYSNNRYELSWKISVALYMNPFNVVSFRHLHFLKLSHLISIPETLDGVDTKHPILVGAIAPDSDHWNLAELGEFPERISMKRILTVFNEFLVFQTAGKHKWFKRCSIS